jgi:ABC-2 type transport system permease protein
MRFAPGATLAGMFWPARIALAKLRPLDGALAVKATIVASLFAGFLVGDFALFARIFSMTAKIEAMTPFFVLGLLQGFLSLVFLVAFTVLFSSAMTAAIGAFFTDLDLETYHAGPVSKTSIVLGRWIKTAVQSATLVFVFLLPLFAAFGRQYHLGFRFYAAMIVNLAILLSIPVSLAATVIVLLVRWFPVSRVHQIVATIAILIFTSAVVAFRMSRPERFFTDIGTDDVVAVLRSLDLPSLDRYPSSWIAELAVAHTSGPATIVILRLALTALGAFTLFVLTAVPSYFVAFVRARESLAPVALGSGRLTRWLDRPLALFSPPVRVMAGKEIRILSRDVAQWSQLFMLAALLFIYLYNIRMLPLGGDSRATIVSYANLGMAGFVVAAICLRFAYPSVSAEGKAVWILRTAPISYRRLLWVKVLVYGTPLMLLALLLTAFANVLLHAGLTVWLYTTIGAVLFGLTLVSLGVSMGAMTPDFGAENALQVGLSLGGFAYMAASLLYVGTVMFLLARPVQAYFLWRRRCCCRRRFRSCRWKSRNEGWRGGSDGRPTPR